MGAGEAPASSYDVAVRLRRASLLIVIAKVIALPSADVDFPTGTGLPTNPATIRIAKIFGIVLFGLLALVAYSVSDLLLEHPWKRLRRRLRKR
jgi:hypothetical protein